MTLPPASAPEGVLHGSAASVRVDLGCRVGPRPRHAGERCGDAGLGRPAHEATADAATDSRPGGRPVKDSWIVTVDERTDPSIVGRAAMAKAAGGTVRRHLHPRPPRVRLPRLGQGRGRTSKKNPHVRTVVADRQLAATAEILTPGVERILADHPTKPDAHDSGFTGAGARVAILDTGIDLTHPDLVANIDAGLGKNCVNPDLPPQDGHGHGTHVAGIVAAVAGNGIGVVGVAPSARLVPFKVLDDTGNGEWSKVICALDVLTGLPHRQRPDQRRLGRQHEPRRHRDDRDVHGRRPAPGVLHRRSPPGSRHRGGAGNSSTDASTFIPAAFPEVIAVSAMADLDGEPGGLGGCQFIVPCSARTATTRSPTSATSARSST